MMISDNDISDDMNKNGNDNIEDTDDITEIISQ